MRILFIAPGAYGEIGGIGLYCRDLAEAMALAPSVQKITIVPRKVSQDVRHLPDKIEFRAGAAASNAGFVKAVLAEAAKGVDLIVCGHTFLLPIAIMAKLATFAPVVLLVYGIDVWQPSGRVSDRLLRFCKAVWSISEVTRDRMLSWCGLEEARFRVLPNAIHLEEYGHLEPSDRLREKHGLDGHKVIITLGRLSGTERYKGFDEVIDCLPRLISKVPTLKYVIVGDGQDRPRLEEKVKAAGLSEQVVFAGFVAEAVKADYYRLADAFVMPGWGEGFGFVFLEAMACGIPVVGSVLDGSKDALKNGELGELVDPKDGDAIVAATLRALDKPKSVPPGLAWFAWPAFCERVEAALAEVAPRSKSNEPSIPRSVHDKGTGGR